MIWSRPTYGFHIIKVVEKRAAGRKALAEVRDQLADQLKWQRAQERATTLSAELDAEIDDPSDLDRVAKAQGLAVKESGFFQRTDPVGELGPSAQVATEAFALKDGGVERGRSASRRATCSSPSRARKTPGCPSSRT